jgi:hypothetical protein
MYQTKWIDRIEPVFPTAKEGVRSHDLWYFATPLKKCRHPTRRSSRLSLRSSFLVLVHVRSRRTKPAQSFARQGLLCSRARPGISREPGVWACYNGPISVEWEDAGMDRFHAAPEALAALKKFDLPPSNTSFDAAFSSNN